VAFADIFPDLLALCATAGEVRAGPVIVGSRFRGVAHLLLAREMAFRLRLLPRDLDAKSTTRKDGSVSTNPAHFAFVDERLGEAFDCTTMLDAIVNDEPIQAGLPHGGPHSADRYLGYATDPDLFPVGSVPKIPTTETDPTPIIVADYALLAAAVTARVTLDAAIDATLAGDVVDAVAAARADYVDAIAARDARAAIAQPGPDNIWEGGS
jgi:hypothetical protein